MSTSDVFLDDLYSVLDNEMLQPSIQSSLKLTGQATDYTKSTLLDKFDNNSIIELELRD